MHTFAFMIIDHRSGAPVATIAPKGIEALSGEAVHQMAHIIANDWMKAQNLDLHHKCVVNAEKHEIAVELSEVEGGPVLIRIEAQHIEMHVDRSPISLLSMLLAGGLDEGGIESFVLNESTINDIPEELKAVLSELTQDPDCPDALKELINKVGGELKGAPPGATKH